MISSHLKLAHQYWKTLLKKNDFVIDATCGNGYDSLILASLFDGHLLCIDIQKQAIDHTKLLLKKHLSPHRLKKISYHLGCHSVFPSFPKPPALIIYNLGYLPRSDKTITTEIKSSLNSLKQGLKFLKPGGTASIMCYSGHELGEQEEAALVSFAKTLKKKSFHVCYHQWINRLKSPSLILIKKTN